MRSAREISFRLRQEAANACFYAFSPRQKRLRAAAPLELLPAPQEIVAGLRNTQFSRDLLGLADRILQNKIPILGTEVDYGSHIAWRRDPLRGIETPLKYFRLIPYLDFAAAGDHKLIWEVNRHQHLVVLGQAFVLSGQEKYFDAIVSHLADWWSNNPFQRGINWASALEVAFRSLSWMWVWHLTGSKMSAEFRQEFLAQLYRHGLHLQYNLSVYFSPNTHLLGEAVALHALGRLFPDWPQSEKWREVGHMIVSKHMQSAVRDDGSYFEQSSYYQIYALDMFLFHAVLEHASSTYLQGLERMTEFLSGIVMPDGTLPFLGDDDGGRFFHPYGDRRRFAVGSVAAASVFLGKTFFDYSNCDLQEFALWWLGPKKCEETIPSAVSSRSRVFPDSGIVVFRLEDHYALFDAGAFGPGNAGHSHADALSLVVWSGGEEILIDPGTYSYMDAEWREIFRGTAAHNSIRIDGQDQAVSRGPFRWIDKADVRLIEFSSTPEREIAIAECSHHGLTHRRTVQFSSQNEIFVVDELSGSASEHLIEQFWHVAATPRQVSPNAWAIGTHSVLTLAGAVCEAGWRSNSFGSKEEAAYIVLRRRSTFPVRLEARLQFLGAHTKHDLPSL